MISMRQMIDLMEASAFDATSYVQRLRSVCATVQGYRNATTPDDLSRRKTARESLTTLVRDGVDHAQKSMSQAGFDKFVALTKQIIAASATGATTPAAGVPAPAPYVPKQKHDPVFLPTKERPKRADPVFVPVPQKSPRIPAQITTHPAAPRKPANNLSSADSDRKRSEYRDAEMGTPRAGRTIW